MTDPTSPNYIFNMLCPNCKKEIRGLANICPYCKFDRTHNFPNPFSSNSQTPNLQPGQNQLFTKLCPVCAKPVKAQAQICRHCKSDLTDTVVNPPVSQPQSSEAPRLQYSANVSLTDRGIPSEATSLNGDSPIVRALSIGFDYMAQGSFELAREQYEYALSAIESEFGTFNDPFATVLQNLAKTYLAQGNLVEAEFLAERSRQVAEQVTGTESETHAQALFLLGQIEFFCQKYDEAKDRFIRVENVYSSLRGANDAQTIHAQRFLAECYLNISAERHKSRALFKEVIQNLEQQYDYEISTIFALYRSWGLSYMFDFLENQEQKPPLEAEYPWRKAWEIIIEQNRTDLEIANTASMFSNMLILHLKFEEAQRVYDLAISRIKQAYGESSTQLIEIYTSYLALLNLTNNQIEATRIAALLANLQGTSGLT